MPVLERMVSEYFPCARIADQALRRLGRRQSRCRSSRRGRHAHLHARRRHRPPGQRGTRCVHLRSVDVPASARSPCRVVRDARDQAIAFTDSFGATELLTQPMRHRLVREHRIGARRLRPSTKNVRAEAVSAGKHLVKHASPGVNGQTRAQQGPLAAAAKAVRPSPRPVNSPPSRTASRTQQAARPDHPTMPPAAARRATRRERTQPDHQPARALHGARVTRAIAKAKHVSVKGRRRHQQHRVQRRHRRRHHSKTSMAPPRPGTDSW